MNWLNRRDHRVDPGAALGRVRLSPPASRAAAEKLSGATTATPAPRTRKPSTATGQAGANTTIASAHAGHERAGPEHPDRAVAAYQAVAREPHAGRSRAR